jgi:hypothetical protein
VKGIGYGWAGIEIAALKILKTIAIVPEVAVNSFSYRDECKAL